MNTKIFSSHIENAIESITDVSEHLVFARDLVRKHVTSTNRVQDFYERINSIDTRARDSRLNLAVIGEFSAGKSTFINALLRQRLLKAACIATTATATYIEMGTEFTVTVTFTDNARITSTNVSYSNLVYRLQNIKSDFYQKTTLNELLDLLTSDQEIANTIKRIDITVPMEYLSKDIVIIDTPGINAGGHNTECHAQVTRDVLEQSADCAVVLIPASSAMSKTLIDFLLQNVKPFLHRCVFILTAVDQLDLHDRTEVIKTVNLKIRDKLNLPNALVFESSALTMIPIKTIPTSMMIDDAWNYWQKQFIQLETQLKQIMLHQRILIITERLVRLLQELVNELSNDLDKKKTKLVQEEKILEENSVVAIEHVMNALYSQSKKKIDNQRNEIIAHIKLKKTTYRNRAKSDIDKFINKTGFVEINNYEDKIEPRIKVEVKYQGDAYAEELDQQLKNLRNSCESICVDFIHQFKLNYKAFPSLNVRLSVPSISISSIATPSISFYSSRRYVEQQKSDDNKGSVTGALIGGVLGSIFGPAGTIWGASIGASIGSGMAGDSLEERQRILRSYAGDDNEKFFDNYQSELIKQLDGIVDNILDQLQKIINAHINEYGTKVSQLIEEHYIAKKRLKREIEITIADGKELSNRRSYLEKIKQKLLQS